MSNQVQRTMKKEGGLASIAIASAISITGTSNAFTPSLVTSAENRIGSKRDSSRKRSLSTRSSSPYFAVKQETEEIDEPLSTGKKSKKRTSPTKKGKETPESTTSSSDVERTQSFNAVTSSDKSVKIHTLVLGTHPSITSLSKEQYFGHAQNAFWWIAGDALGFRRSLGISESTGKPFKITEYILEPEEKVIPYEKQLELFTSKGFALWDLFQSCERKGSLDSDIKNEVTNDIRSFCEEHQTIQRIILANGSGQSKFFNQHFKQWWLDGGLIPGENDMSQKQFKKWAKQTNKFQKKDDQRQIAVICMPGVSPAAASISYEKKREAFIQYCYQPGLEDHKKLN